MKIKSYVNQVSSDKTINSQGHLYELLLHNLNSRPNFHNSGSFKTSVLEHQFAKCGETIYIENKDVLSFILNMKIKYEDGFVVPNLFPAFSVAFTFDSSWLGYHLPGYLSSIIDTSDYSIVVQDFFNYLGFKAIPRNSSTHEQSIMISYGQKNKGSRFQNIPNDALKELLSADCSSKESIIKNAKLVASRHKARNYENGLQDRDIVIGFLIAKLTINLVVYNRATDNRYLVKGLPESIINKPMLQDEKSYSHVLRIPKNKLYDVQQNSFKTTHIRSGYFRILKHERYYRNNNFEPGSRVVEVKPTLVKGRAYTQTKGTHE